MGHYWSEMRDLEPDEKLQNFLSEENEGVSFTLTGPKGKKLLLTRREISKLLNQRALALAKVNAMRNAIQDIVGASR